MTKTRAGRGAILERVAGGLVILMTFSAISCGPDRDTIDPFDGHRSEYDALKYEGVSFDERGRIPRVPFRVTDVSGFLWPGISPYPPGPYPCPDDDEALIVGPEPEALAVYVDLAAFLAEGEDRGGSPLECQVLHVIAQDNP